MSTWSSLCVPHPAYTSCYVALVLQAQAQRKDRDCPVLRKLPFNQNICHRSTEYDRTGGWPTPSAPCHDRYIQIPPLWASICESGDTLEATIFNLYHLFSAEMLRLDPNSRLWLLYTRDIALLDQLDNTIALIKISGEVQTRNQDLDSLHHETHAIHRGERMALGTTFQPLECTV